MFGCCCGVCPPSEGFKIKHQFRWGEEKVAKIFDSFSFCSQSGFPEATWAIALGSSSWHRLPTPAPICKGSSLKWLPLAGSSIIKTLGQQQPILSLGALTSLVLLLVPGPCSLSTISRAAHSRTHRVLWTVTEWNCSFWGKSSKVWR